MGLCVVGLGCAVGYWVGRAGTLGRPSGGYGVGAGPGYSMGRSDGGDGTAGGTGKSIST